MLSTFPIVMIPMTTSSTPPIPPAIGQPSPLTHQVMWDVTLQSPSIPTMLSTFPIVMTPIPTSSTPPVQAVAQPQAIGTMPPLTHQVLWDVTLQSPSIPTMLSTFPTLISPMRTSSTPPVQAVAQPQAIGTMPPLTHQVLWDMTLQSPSIPTMLSTFPTLISPMPTSSTPPVQAVAQPQAIGTMPPLTHQVLWDMTLQSPSIPTMLSTFPT